MDWPQNDLRRPEEKPTPELPPLPPDECYEGQNVWGRSAMEQFARDYGAPLLAEIERLQIALHRWLPHVRGDDSPEDVQASMDSYLLRGLEGDCGPEVGEERLQRLEAQDREIATLKAHLVQAIREMEQANVGSGIADAMRKKVERERDELRAKLEAGPKNALELEMQRRIDAGESFSLTAWELVIDELAIRAKKSDPLEDKARHVAD